MFKIYCINIKERSDRREKILCQLSHYNSFDLEFIEAITKKNFTEEQFLNFENYQKSGSKKKITKFLSKEEICTFHSHLKAFENFQKSDFDYALILEDDVIFEDNFFLIFTKLWTILKKNDILLLGGDSGIAYFNNMNQWKGINKFILKILGRKFITNNFYIGYPIDRIWGAYGYLIGKTAASKLLLEYNRGLLCVADQMTSDSPRFNINLMAINKPIILHDYSSISNIREQHEFMVQKGIRYGFYSSILRIVKRNFKIGYPYIN